MRRKTIAGFRTLLDEVCDAWSDSGFNWGTQDNDREASDKRASRARNKLEKLLLNVLVHAEHDVKAEREGWAVPASQHGLRDALDKIASHAKMDGRKFTSGHSLRTQRARAES